VTVRAKTLTAPRLLASAAMKCALIVALAMVASCKDKPRESPPRVTSASGSAAASAPVDAGAPAFDVCRIGLAALDQAACPTPQILQSLLAAKKSLHGVVDTVGKLGGASPEKFQVMCAQLLLAIERDAVKVKCTVTLAADDRAKIMTLLDAWYAQRTPVAPTGDAASDAVIAKIVALRDAACECKDAACLERLDKQLVEIGTLPATAPEAARTLGGKLLEDVGRCASRIRTLTDPR
jgi:hypothetical protein